MFQMLNVTANYPEVLCTRLAALERGGDIGYHFENRLDNFGHFST